MSEDRSPDAMLSDLPTAAVWQKTMHLKIIREAIAEHVGNVLKAKPANRRDALLKAGKALGTMRRQSSVMSQKALVLEFMKALYVKKIHQEVGEEIFIQTIAAGFRSATKAKAAKVSEHAH